MSKAQSVTPSFIPELGHNVAIGIFSIGGTFDSAKTELLANSFVVGRRETSKYYGVFSSHPVVSPYVNVNDPLVLQTWILRCLSGVDGDLLRLFSKGVVEERRKGNFKNQEDLVERLRGEFDFIDNVQFSPFLLYHFE